MNVLIPALALSIGFLMFRNRAALMDAAIKLSDKWSKLNPEVKTRSLRVLDRAAIEFEGTGYTVHIFDGWRPISAQKEHIASGASFVTNPASSYHVWGLAVDFVFKDHLGNWTWEPGADCSFFDLTCHGTDWYWDRLGEIIEQAGFEWGGRWRNFDGPHAQLTSFGTTQQLIAQHGTPSAANGFA